MHEGGDDIDEVQTTDKADGSGGAETRACVERDEDLEDAHDEARPYPGRGVDLGKRSYLHSSVAEHLRANHRHTPQEYRKEVLSDAVRQWPEEVSPQVLRSRLTAYKQHFSDSNFAKGVCASCARYKRKNRLLEAWFPSSSAESPPEWLEWDKSAWTKFGRQWCQQVDDIFNIEVYLQKYFEADARVREAEQELTDFLAGSRTPEGFRSAREAKTWCERVRVWRRNLRASLEEDSVQAPGMHIPVLPSQAMYEREIDYVVVLAWNFAAPIMQNHAAFRERGGHFIVPLPAVEVH